MLLFVLWAVLAIGVLASAGYSHYRYRVRNNQHYERLFAKRQEEPDSAPIKRYATHPRIVPVVTLVVVGLLVPMSLVI